MVSEKSAEWKERAFADLSVVWDALYELEDIADRIDQALDEDNKELYLQAISDFTGLDEK